MTKAHLNERHVVESVMADRVEELLRARAKATGVKPQALLAQAVKPEEAAESHIVQTLLQRLKERD